MNNKCYDNNRTPIIITDKTGTVIYKNHSAFSQIKKIRHSRNIFKYTSAEELGETPVYISVEYIEGSGIDSVRRCFRAFVMTHENGLFIWMFPRRLTHISIEQALRLFPVYTVKKSIIH